MAPVQQQQFATNTTRLGRLRVCGEDSLGLLLLAKVLSLFLIPLFVLEYMMVHTLVMFLLTLLLLPQYRKLLMYAPQEEQPKQSLTREEMTEVGAQPQRSSDAAHHHTGNQLYVSTSTAGENHL